MKKIIFCLFLLLGGCATQSPQMAEYARCQSLMTAKQYSRAIYACLPPAKRGSAEAQYSIGYLYANGLGVTRDQQMARYWIAMSAKQGDVSAIKALSVLDANGQQDDARGSFFMPKGSSA